MTLSQKGRYWQISGLEKQVGLRAIIYIRAPAGECSKGRFRALFGGARRSETRTPVSDAPSPPVPFFLTPPEGAGGIPGYRRWPTVFGPGICWSGLSLNRWGCEVHALQTNS
jgi:hypothetical protein